MNLLDIVIIGIIICCVFSSYHRGLILSVYKLCSNIISIVLAWISFPAVTRILRNTGVIYEYLKNTIAESLDLKDLIYEPSLKAQNEIISRLPIPEFLKTSMISGNNPVVYNALNVSKIEDYIAGYLANICINIIAFLLVCIIVKLVMQSIASGLNIIAKLPVIRTFNKLGGAIVGLIQGMIMVWLLIMGIVLISPMYEELLPMVQNSLLALYFYNYNLLLDMIKNVVL